MSSILSSKEDIPAFFRDVFDETLCEVFASYLGALDDFPYTVLLSEKHINPMMLCIIRNAVYVFEKSEAVRVHAIHRNNLNYLEIGKELLHAWMHINLIDIPNVHLKIKFNITCEYMFEPIIHTIRNFHIHESILRHEPADISEQLNPENFKGLKSENYKLVNFAKGCILPGEKVLSYLYQPTVHAKTWGIINRIVLYPHISVLTNKEWIFIKDGSISSKSVCKVPYGGLWYYVPLYRITEVRVIALEDNTVKQQVVLSNGEMIEYIYHSSLKEQVTAFTVKITHALPKQNKDQATCLVFVLFK